MHIVVIHFDPNKYIDQNYQTNLHDAKPASECKLINFNAVNLSDLEE